MLTGWFSLQSAFVWSWFGGATALPGIPATFLPQFPHVSAHLEKVKAVPVVAEYWAANFGPKP